MQRREFMAIVGGAAAAWPLFARAQQPARKPRLGVLLYSTPEEDAQAKVLREGLRELGYLDGQNISIEYRFAEGRPERLADLAADLVRLKPDVLFPVGGGGAVRQQSDADDSDRICDERRPAAARACCQRCAARRQHHWLHIPAGRTRLKTPPAVQGSSAPYFARGVPVDSGSSRQRAAGSAAGCNGTRRASAAD